MSSYQYPGNSNAPPEGRSDATGLEGHLRSLILNSPPVPAESPQHYAPIQPPVSSHDHGFIAPPPGFEPHAQTAAQQDQVPDESMAMGAFHHKGSIRKRPNQAQRRQMSSQLSIPVDTRPAQQPNNWRGFDHGQSQNQNHHNSYLPRHQHTMSHPHGNTDHFRSRQQGQGSWNGPLAFSSPGNSFSHDACGHNQGGYQQPHRHSQAEHRPRHNPGMSQGYRRQPFTQEEVVRQSTLLEELCFAALASSEIDRAEIAEKEAFRQRIELICRQVIAEHEWNEAANHDFPPPSVELRCFGSLSSGFATKASDMDLGLISPFSPVQPDAPGSPIPRLIEKAFLEAGIGARLLSRTRVPIIKLCEAPPESLLKGLLAQREKWENGLDQDHNESHDEDDQGVDHTGEKDEEPAQTTGEEETAPADLTSFQVPDEQGQWNDFHLKQTSKHNLAAYYGLAKRVLRKAGGRDVTMSNARDFTPHDWDVLNRVCQAFVRGLADADLRRSLDKYPSLAFDLDSGFPQNRSLLGVSLQAEGEQVLHLWQNWSVAGELLAQDPALEQYIGYWYEVQKKENFGQDPISYTKELQLGLERLKKLPPFQLLLLEQGPQETVTQYYQRTRIITKNVKSPMNGNAHLLRREIVQRYVAGIGYDDVRNEIRAWQSDTENWDLDAVSYKHKSLNLAGELQRALNKNLYDDVHLGDVNSYIRLLRGPQQQITTPNGKRAFIIPVRDEMVQLVTRIKILPDPHKMAPNQPRDRYHDPLAFPKDGAGVQCDINFAAHLALQNTLLLRCYSHTDPRVRAMILFVKHWAKMRGVNSGYRGTLSSYGYVLMVLHYLVNVASPFVCPNLQQVAAPGPGEELQTCKGYNVQFWRNEAEILHLARSGQINNNQQTIGYLLRGFFEYFAQNGALSTVPGRGFDWGRDVLSLRSHGGLLTKQEKGWTGAKTVYQVQDPSEPAAKPASQNAASQDQTPGTPKTPAVKEVRLRYLFAIEDPFELEHNVARTVTHNGIVSIRDEFRRAWRIIQAAGNRLPHDDLLQDVNGSEEGVNPFVQLIDDIHGMDRTNV